MSGVSKSAAFLIALFGAVPVGLITALITLELFANSTNLATSPLAQQVIAIVSGLAYGLATFTFLYQARRVE